MCIGSPEDVSPPSNDLTLQSVPYKFPSSLGSKGLQATGLLCRASPGQVPPLVDSWEKPSIRNKFCECSCPNWRWLEPKCRTSQIHNARCLMAPVIQQTLSVVLDGTLTTTAAGRQRTQSLHCCLSPSSAHVYWQPRGRVAIQ